MATATETEEPPAYIEHELAHTRQRFTWDCGVSCVLMLLDPRDRTQFIQQFDDICAEEGFFRSTWTIDLCFLLKRYKIDHVLHTMMAGVNDEYKKYSYYRDIIAMDRARVSGRFSLAPSMGIPVLRARLSASALLRHLAAGPAILLVDAPLLVCEVCKHNKVRHEIRRIFGGSYRGHYILVTGYIGKGKRALYRDPSAPHDQCVVSLTRLMQAAGARGTDCDAILVCKDYRKR